MDTTMTDRAPARRGRPKGTGIDDTGLLQQVRAALAADPALRPTAAIRAAGVADPSAIRRLRDKLAAAPVATKKATKSSSERPVVPLKAGPAAIKTARTRPAARRPAAVPPNGPAETPDAQTLANYLAAVGGAPVASPAGRAAIMTAAAPATGPLAGAPAERTDGAATAALNTAARVRASGPEAPAQTRSGTSAVPPSPFEMMARMAAPMTASPQMVLEGVRLAVEVTAAVSRLQVFMMQGSLKGTPLAMMLQGQAAMAQMMLATLAGALVRPPTKT